MDTEKQELYSRLQEALWSNQRLALYTKCLIVTTVVLSIAAALQFRGTATVTASDRHDDDIKVRSLAIVDANGKTRVLISTPLPEPIILGKTMKRDASTSGILLYDALGNERGGYVTDNSEGNALLSLDSAIGQDVTIVAYPKGGAELGLNDDARNKVVLGALASGPTIRLMRSGQWIARLPEQPAVVK